MVGKTKRSSFSRSLLHGLDSAVPHINALYEIDDILSDVGGVIGNPFQIARHEH